MKFSLLSQKEQLAVIYLTERSETYRSKVIKEAKVIIDKENEVDGSSSTFGVICSQTYDKYNTQFDFFTKSKEYKQLRGEIVNKPDNFFSKNNK